MPDFKKILEKTSVNNIKEKKEDRQKQEKNNEDNIHKTIDDIYKKKYSHPENEKQKETVTKPDLKLSNTDRDNIKKQMTKKLRLRRKEKKLYNNFEHDPDQSRQMLIMFLAIIGMFFLVILYSYTPNNGFVIAIIILVGSMMFLPVGAILGWMFDPYIRCKILRKITKHNWGILNFVSNGNKIFTKMKNFDMGLIWRGEECWVLTKNKLMQMTKNGNLLNQGETIDVENAVSVVDTVPMLFVDVDSMEPLGFNTIGREAVDPEELGSTLKAWEANVKAKVMRSKKNLDLYIIIAMAAAIAAAGIAFMAYDGQTQLQTQLDAMREQLTYITQQLTQ